MFSHPISVHARRWAATLSCCVIASQIGHVHGAQDAREQDARELILERPDPDNAFAYIAYAIQPMRHGIPRAVIETVRSRPAHFAPAIRSHLLDGLPDTLDEYSLDDPRWITNSHPDHDWHSPEFALMILIRSLGREHAEPILQEFFHKVNPLALEAERRHWEAKDAALAAGRNTGEEWVSTLHVYRSFSGVRGSAIKVARDFGSDIFYDDFLDMLTSHDPVAQETGANYTRGYLGQIIQKRPDAVARIAEAMPRLLASEDPRVARAGRALMKRLEEGPGSREDDPHNPWGK